MHQLDFIFFDLESDFSWVEVMEYYIRALIFWVEMLNVLEL